MNRLVESLTQPRATESAFLEPPVRSAGYRLGMSFALGSPWVEPVRSGERHSDPLGDFLVIALYEQFVSPEDEGNSRFAMLDTLPDLVSDSVVFGSDDCDDRDDGCMHRLELFVGDGFSLAPSVEVAMSVMASPTEDPGKTRDIATTGVSPSTACPGINPVAPPGLICQNA
jgi:hypothetical protein